MTTTPRRTTDPMPRSGPGRRTVLVTGATGVVGQALIPRLVDHGAADVICLTHRAAVRTPSPSPHAGNLSTVQGDVARADLGLGAREYRELAARIDVVVHAAALTDFAGPDETLHRAAGAVLSGIAPILPFGASWPFDFIPQDIVADTIAGIVEHERIGEELWVTAGPQALTLAQAVDVLVATGRQLGIKVDTPRFVSPEQFDRIIAPVFLPELPAKMRTTITRLLDFFAVYLDRDEPMPSSLPTLEEQGITALPDLAESLRRSLIHWHTTREKTHTTRAVA